MRKFMALVLVPLLMMVLVSCGGGGSSPTQVQQSTTVSGTAAIGAPLANASVEIRDDKGNKKTGTTNSLGKYSIDVKGLTGPYLVLVTSSSGTHYYSISSSTGTVNVHPFTSLIVRNWYKVKSMDIDVVFPSTGVIQVPTATEISTIEAVIRSIILSWLEAAGLNTSSFNLISSSFDADGTGFDKVLEILTVSIAGGTITITPIDQSGNTGNPIASLPESMDLASNPLQSIKDGVNQVLSEWMTIVNSKPTATVSDLIHLYYPTNYLNMGMNASQDILDTLSPNNHPGTMSIFRVKDIVAYDDMNKVISVTVEYSSTNWGTGITDVGNPWNFKYDSISGKWLLNGDQMIAGIDLAAGVKKNIPGTLTYIVDPEVWAPAGTVTSVQVAGPALVNNPTVLTKVTGGGGDGFHIPGDGATAIAPQIGSIYTFTLATSSSGTVVYKKTLYGTTSETFNILSPTGSTLADAKLGNTLNVSWTLPTSFDIHDVSLVGGVNAAAISCGWMDGTVASSKTSGSIVLPTLCGGQPVTNAWIAVYVSGPRGIQTAVNYVFY